MVRRQDRTHHRQQRELLSPEIQSVIRKRETAGRRKNRELLPPELVGWLVVLGLIAL